MLPGLLLMGLRGGNRKDPAYVFSFFSPSPIASNSPAGAYRQGETYPYPVDNITAVSAGPRAPYQWKCCRSGGGGPFWDDLDDVPYLRYNNVDAVGASPVLQVMEQPLLSDISTLLVDFFVRDSLGNFDFAASFVTVLEGPVATGPSILQQDADFSLFGTNSPGDISTFGFLVSDNADGFEFRVRNDTNTGPSTVVKVQGAVDNDTWFAPAGVTSQLSGNYEALSAYAGGEQFTLEVRNRKGFTSTALGTVIGP